MPPSGATASPPEAPEGATLGSPRREPRGEGDPRWPALSPCALALPPTPPVLGLPSGGGRAPLAKPFSPVGAAWASPGREPRAVELTDHRRANAPQLMAPERVYGRGPQAWVSTRPETGDRCGFSELHEKPHLSPVSVALRSPGGAVSLEALPAIAGSPGLVRQPRRCRGLGQELLPVRLVVHIEVPAEDRPVRSSPGRRIVGPRDR